MTEKEKVINVALNEVGYKEKETNSNLDDKTANAGDENFTKYARDLDNLSFYNGKKNGYDWCDIFVDWCFVKAFGVDRALELLCQPKKSTGAGCAFSMNFYKEKGQFSKEAKKGSQIFFTDGESIYHTGLVYKVDSSKVYTIEGNTNGGEVAKKSYPLNASYIAGYGEPKYDETSTAEEEKVEETESTNKAIATVKVTAKAGLNIRKEPNTECEILGAYTYNSSREIYEVKGKWGRTKDGWIYLEYTDYKSNSSSSNSTTSKYTTGRYIVNTEVLTVRKSPYVNANDDNWLKFSELTANAQSQVLKLCGYKPNGLCAGVFCDVSEVKNNWGKIPSGWICLDYCKKQ